MQEAHLKNTGSGRIQNWVFGIILIGLFLLVCRLFKPFAAILLWSVLLFIIVEPLHSRAVRGIKANTNAGRILRRFAAVIFAFGTVLVILVPLGFVLFRVYLELLDVFSSIRGHTMDKSIIYVFCEKARLFVEKVTGGQVNWTAQDVYMRIINLTEKSVFEVVSYSGAILRDVGIFIISVALVVFCLFFYFLDGIYLAHIVKKIVPIKQHYITTITSKFKEITRNLIFGYLIVALIQAVLAFVIFVLFDINGALLFACLTFICVFVPVIGGALVWLPLGIIKAAGGDIGKGIAFMLVSFVCVSLLDNVLRPLFLQNRLRLHPLVIFFSILGGIALFNIHGLILGPMIVVLFLTVLELFFKEHHIHYDEGEVE